MRTIVLPFLLGVFLAAFLRATVGWWGFLVLFPWIGFSLSVGMFVRLRLPNPRKDLGRRIAILMVLPALLLFVPLVNNENFQLEGIVLLIAIGYFSKGVIHYAVAKVFGPLVWGRGFCGWACWTAAVLEWLPVRDDRKTIPARAANLRVAVFALSVSLPLVLVFFCGFDVRRDYLYKSEMYWMLAGNALYYAIAVPLAFAFRDRRAFCKIACPVSLVMKVPARFARLKVRPSSAKCLECGLCNEACPMDVDVRSFIAKGLPVGDTECILCGRCRIACPAGAMK